MQNDVQQLLEMKAAAFDFRIDIESRTSYYQNLVQQIAELENRIRTSPVPSPEEPEAAPEAEPVELETIG